jgi:hypothetical protein
MTNSEFFAQPQVVQALEELEQTCFELRERGVDEDAFPGPAIFLRERGIVPPDGRKLQVRHTIEHPETRGGGLAENMPNKPGCPGGTGDCWPGKCKWIKGEYVCSWICDCR